MSGKVKDSSITLRGGVVVIGSLYWDASEIRSPWRSINLVPLDGAISVPVPIRYGRISQSRNCTFSMVFSSDCKQSEKLGMGKFLPFLNNPITMDELWNQCAELIKAERNKESLTSKIFNWSWGALGLSVNPSFSDNNLEKAHHVNLLMDTWKTKFGKQMLLKSTEFRIGEEAPSINNDGLLNIMWPDELHDYDFLIATAVKPEREIYPNAFDVAQRMLVNEDESYFRNNNASGINTFQDSEILRYLENMTGN